MSEFVTKDSGERVAFESGMVRDVEAGKTLYHLVYSGPMFERWAQLLTRGAEKYDEDNWMLANGEKELKRFRKSAWRHFIQWQRGDVDEDHAAAVFFNINGYEYVKARLEKARAAAWDGPFPGDPPAHWPTADETVEAKPIPSLPKYWQDIVEGEIYVGPEGETLRAVRGPIRDRSTIWDGCGLENNLVERTEGLCGGSLEYLYLVKA